MTPVQRAGDIGALASELLQTLSGRLAAAPARLVVGLTGPPGAGKSTLAEQLEADLAERGLLAGTAPMDGFHLSNAVLDALGRHGRKGAPDTFDVEGYLALLDRVRTGADVLAPVYRRDLHEPVAAGSLISGPGVVITEGNYLALEDHGWHAARERIDLLIHLEVEPEELARRLVARHESFGKDRARAAHWVRTVDMPNARVVEAGAHRCDEVWTVAPQR